MCSTAVAFPYYIIINLYPKLLLSFCFKILGGVSPVKDLSRALSNIVVQGKDARREIVLARYFSL